MDNPTLQIVEYDTKRAMVTDVWESADHKLLLKCIKSRVMGKLPWSTGFGEEYDGAPCSRNRGKKRT